MTEQDRPPQADPDAAQREADFLDRVRSIVPLVREKALEAEELRCLPESTMQAIEETGMFRLHTPLVYGGLQLGLNAHAQAARLLAQGDVSTAWVASFLATGGLRLVTRSKEQQDAIFSVSPDVRTCGSGQAREGSSIVKDGDSYIVNGRWGFASGVLNADTVEVIIGAANGQGQAKAEFTAALIPTDRIQIDDVWHMSGMKATGSQDVLIDNVRIEPKWVSQYNETYTKTSAPQHPDYALLRCPIQHIIWTLHAAYILGPAERALEYFRTDIAPRRKRPFTTEPLIESPVVQRNYGEARYLVETSAVLFDHRIKTIVDLYENGLDPDWDLRAYLNTEAVGIMRSAAQAIQIVARMSGGTMHRSNNELDRAQRDVEVLMNHASADWDTHAESSGRVQLGLGLGKRSESFF